MINQVPHKFQQAIEYYINRDFVVIPLNGKRPIVQDWTNATLPTPEQIASWPAGCNIGIVSGEQSNNLIFIDFDGWSGYEAFKAKFPAIASSTFTVATGSGKGCHVYLQVDLLPRTTKAMRIEALGGANIELKSSGQQVVAAPSIHPDTGQPYAVMIRKPVLRLTDVQDIIAWIETYKPVEQRRKEKVWQQSDSTETPGDVLDRILLHYGLSTTSPHNNSGMSRIAVLCPFHDDHEPSAGVKIVTDAKAKAGGLTCTVCGWHNWREHAEALGIAVPEPAAPFTTRDDTDYEALANDEYRTIIQERISEYEAGVYRSWWDFNGIWAGWLSALLGLTKTRSSTVLVLLRMHDCFRQGALNWAQFSAADVIREVKLPRATIAAALEDLREWNFVRFVWTGNTGSLLPSQVVHKSTLRGRPTRYYTIETDTDKLQATLSRMIETYHIEKYHAKTLAPVDALMAEQIGLTEYADYQAYKMQMAAVKQDYQSHEAQKALTKELHGDGYNWHGWQRALEWREVVWFDWWYECDSVADVRALFLRWWIENVRTVNTRLELQRVLGCSDTALSNIMERANVGSERRDKSEEFKAAEITDLRELTRNIQRKERAMIWTVRFKYAYGWKTVEANGKDLAQQAAYIYARDKKDIEKVWVKYCQPSVQFLLSEEQILQNATQTAQDAIVGDSSAVMDDTAIEPTTPKKRKEAVYKQRNHNWTQHRMDWLYNQLRLRVWCFTLLTLEGWRLLDNSGQVIYEGASNADITRWLNQNASAAPLRKSVDFFGLPDDDPRELDIEITNILTFDNRYFQAAWEAERSLS